MWAFALASLLAATAPEVTAKLSAGAPATGALTELTATELALQTPTGPRRFPRKDVLVISFKGVDLSAEIAAVHVQLADGTVLSAKDYRAAGEQATVTLAGSGTIKIPTKHISAVRLKQPGEATNDEWSRIVDSKPANDLIVIRKDEALDYLEGQLGAVSADSIQFELDGEKIPVKRAKVEGLVYFHATQPEFGASAAIVHDRQGSQWQAAQLTVEADALALTTPAGIKARLPWPTVAEIDFSQGKIVYLSDLQPQSAQWTPYVGFSQPEGSLAQYFRPRSDVALDGGPLKLQGTTYEKGLALHSRTQVVYRLPAKFSRFVALAGIDDSVAPLGNVRLTIHGDDQQLLDETIRGGEAPKAIELDLKGVRRLTILADYGEDLDLSDHLDLCEARIIQ